MWVICKVGECPYNSNEGFCRNKVVQINQRGLCAHLYNKNGNPREHWQEKIEEEYKQKQYEESK